MADIPNYDLQDEIDCSFDCESVIKLCELIDKLISDIQFLELECISTRYLLSQRMDKEDGELLRMDIMSHLTGRYAGDPAYELFKAIMYSGGDPMDFHEYHVKVRKACSGKWPCWH